jgi:hypothetical protein
MDYERGLAQLKQRLHNTTWEQEFLVYESRLRDNLHRERLYGSNEQIRSDRAQVVYLLNRLARQININFNDLCLNPQARTCGAQEGDRRDKLRKRLKDIENAIIGGNYYSAYREVMKLSKHAAEEMSIQETARLKYLEALIHLSGRRPCKHAPSVMKQAEAALQDASRLHNLASYKKILALVKQDFARTGVQVKKHKDEAYKLANQANRLSVTQEDREIIALFSRCHPQLSQEYSHLLSH